MRFDANDDATRADPYPAYAISRARDGLMRLGPGQWGVTRHAEVARLLGADGVGSSLHPEHLALSHRNRRVADFLSRIVLYAEPPRHAALRRTLSPATSSQAVTALGLQMSEICAPVFAAVPPDSVFDIPCDIGAPIAAKTLSRLLQIEPAIVEILPRAARAIGAVFAMDVEEQALMRAAEAIEFLGQTALRAQEQSPILRDIARRATDEGIDSQTLRDNLVFVMFAGFETTAAMIGNAVAWLLEDRARMADLRHGNVDLSVDAVLRDDPPIQGVARVMERDGEVCGRHLRAGRLLVLFLASANRDATPALSFGGGRHRCPGEFLARSELRSVLGWMSKTPKPLVISGPAIRSVESSIRRFEALPVRFGTCQGDE